MIVGVGVDVVDVNRFAAALGRSPRIAARLFTPAERASSSAASLAARFAAKEALAKAVGAPKGLRWHDAEITTGTGGRPQLRVDGTVARLAASLGVSAWHVTLSHDGGLAVAVVVAEG